MAAQTEVAMVDWAPIPADRLSAICDMTRVACGAFLPSNGQVLDAYLDARRRERRVQIPSDYYVPDSLQDDEAEEND